jgi:hypothetical protein
MAAVMDHAERLRRLPLAYAVALRLSEAGADEATIAAALGVEPESVGPLLDVARAKVERIARDDADQKSGQKGVGRYRSSRLETPSFRIAR